MRIVYAGDLDPGSTCFHRLGAMRRLGHEVHAVQIFPTEGLNSVVSKLRHRVLMGPGLRAINQGVREAVRSHRPDVLWVDKGIYLWPQTIRESRDYARAVVHYNPDDPFGKSRWGWRLLLLALADYDLHFVARDVNVEEYLHAGARRAVRFLWGYESTIHYPRDVSPAFREKYGAPVGFVGSYEKERAETMYAVAEAGIPIRIWGNGWERSYLRHRNLKIEYKGLVGDLYAEALSSFDINLCFLRKLNRDLSTTRSIEIPACGAFMLAERTTEHLRLFEEGRDASFFDTNSECIAKLRHYLDRPMERKQIAAGGRLRCLESGYSNESRLSYMLKQVEAIARPIARPRAAITQNSHRILYIGDLSVGATCRMRAETLRTMGNEVIELNIVPFSSPSSDAGILPRVAMRLQPTWLAGVRELNKKMLDLVELHRPDIVWVDKGTLITRKFIIAAKEASPATWLHYNPDDPFGKFRKHWRIFLESLSMYDIHFVPRPQNVVEYLARGAPNVFEFDRGYQPTLHKPMDLSEDERRRFGSAVGFVGSWATAREGSIASLIESGINVSVIGDGWVGRKRWPVIKSGYRESGVYAADYARALCGLDIALHFVRHENRDFQDSRTFEIPACGVFMLAERTSKHLELFQEDKEAVFFSSNEELLAKVKYYLDHPAERRTIAAAGRQRCINSGYDYRSRLAQMLKTTAQFMGAHADASENG